MTNTSNFGTATGRLTKDPVNFANNDGSVTKLFELAIKRNFTNREGKYETDYPQFSVYVPASYVETTQWNNVGEGDLIQVGYDLRRVRYQKNGETVYPGNTVNVTGMPQYLEPKEVTSERRARKAAEKAAQNQAAQPTAPSTPAQPAAPAADQESEIARLERELAEAQAQTAQPAAAAAPAANQDYSTDTPFG